MINLNEELPVEEVPADEIPAEQNQTVEPPAESSNTPDSFMPSGTDPDEDLTDNFLYMTYDHDGYPADASTMLIDMTMLNGDHLQRIEIWLMLIALLLLLRLFTKRRH